jgi:feruloyl esterase
MRTVITLLLLLPGAALADPASTCRDLGSHEFRIEGSIPVEVHSGELIPAAGNAPDYCALQGVIAPAVGFELRLPVERWNGNYLQQGCSGLCGTIKMYAADDALSRGYAVASTDMGHKGHSTRTGIWAYENPSAKRDFWYRGTHITAVAAKHLVTLFYGEPPAHSIHRGCGTGGRAGLAEAQRFPDDFDGILVTGGAVLNFVRNNLSLLWNIGASQDCDGEPALSTAEIEMLHNAVLADCAEPATGIVANPLNCRFDPAQLACPDDRPSDLAACLTREKLAVVARFYDGPRNSHGEQLYSGHAKGSELGWSRTYFQPSFMSAFVTQLFGYLVLAAPPGPEFSARDVDFDLPLERYAPAYKFGASDSTDYEGFKARGGKLLMAYGWNESSMPGPHATAYFDRVVAANGGLEATQEWCRVALPASGVPGKVRKWIS